MRHHLAFNTRWMIPYCFKSLDISMHMIM